MSLILDALKKSEAERQRQSGPTLLEVRVTQPRRRYPAWVIAVGVLLAVNILLLLAFVVHRPVAAPLAVPAASVAAGATPPPTTQNALPASAAPMAAGAATAPAPTLLPASASTDSIAAAPLTAVPPSDGAADGQNSLGNPADDEPALPAGSTGHYSSLPSYSDVGGDLPALRLDLHVYAERARDRYALVNMHRVHEGDVLPEGPRVLAITREGVAMDYRGQEFMLHPQ
jgi:general secretion pathway protein B